MSDVSPQYAFVTLVTSDYYLSGALVVAAALRELHPSPPIRPEELDPCKFHLICLVTPETVSVQTLKLLRRTFDVVIGVEIIEGDTEDALNLLGRPDLATVLAKLHIFRLKAYRKIIYLDADVLPLLPLSHLFRKISSFAAVPDVGWPDIFNSGVLVFTPGEDDFDQIMRIVRSEGSWDGGDQGVLNEWRSSNWERLSFTYNTTPTGAYTYAPAYKRFGSEIKIIHFIGPNKPWSQAPLRATASSQSTTSISATSLDERPSYAYASLLDRWFAIFDKYYRSAAPIFTTTGSLIPDTTFVEKTYENVWDSGFKDGVSGEASLALDGLRKLALEGLGQVPTAETGEGAYMTLPLEGRLDLMPPRRSHFPMSSSPSMTSSSASMDPLESLHDGTSLGESPESIPELSVSNKAHHENPGYLDVSTTWDPWTNRYQNTWDLIPGIVQRYATHSMVIGQRTGQDTERQSISKSIEPIRGQDKEESTSTDGDDEAEDEDN